MRDACFTLITHLATGCLSCLLLWALPVRADAPVKELWLVTPNSMSPAEQGLAVSLQGLLNRSGPRVWLQAPGMTDVLLREMEREGTVIHKLSSVWSLLDKFRDNVQGCVVYKLGTPSINAATSLCGILNCVAVDVSILTQAQGHGLKVMADARELSDRQVWDQYKEQFAKGWGVEQKITFPMELRDYAIQNNLYTFYGGRDSAYRKKIAQALGPQAILLGWTHSEEGWIQDLSKAGAAGLAADWCVNLSAMSKATVAIPTRPRCYPEPVRAGERIVAFVMSDGDNLAFMANDFCTMPGFWANRHRGQFNMTWEMAPSLASIAPRAMRYFYNEASRGKYIDDFVCGPSGAGYTFPTLRPDRLASAQQTAEALKASDLSIISLLDIKGDMSQTTELLEQPEVMGIIYKDYVPYNKFAGRIFWHQGKPSISYTYLLFEGQEHNSPAEVAESIGKLPADPQNDPRSYATINVHAWSWKKMGGPMEAVKQTIDKLPANTRVVTAEQLIILLRNNFGTPVAPPEKNG